MQTRTYKGFAGFLVLIILSGCHSSSSNLISNLYPGLQNTPGVADPISGPSGPVSVCSPLDFSNVSWDSALSPNDRNALEIGLNISGSYEGADGWANLTNNFDGEGVSMGLLNQNLGTGSLQPLLIKMRDSYLPVLQSIFDSGRLQSLLAMLTQWQGSAAAAAFQNQFAPLIGPENEPISLLDEPVIQLESSLVLASANQKSVAWATSTLYTDGGKTFDQTWLKDLMALGASPSYVSIQIEAAMDLHRLALTEEGKGGVHELRAYLLMFDINVQDGGMYSQDWTDFASWLASNGLASDTARLNELLVLRLRHVKPQYVSDVRSRKQTIIDGKGFVHGDSRNLPTEYCYNPMTVYP